MKPPDRLHAGAVPGGAFGPGFPQQNDTAQCGVQAANRFSFRLVHTFTVLLLFAARNGALPVLLAQLLRRGSHR
jgi:hypothetical protein